MIEKLFKEPSVKFYGEWKFTVRDDKTGEIVSEHCERNLIPTVGLVAVAAQFGNIGITKDIGDNLYVALGDDNTPAAAGDTTLGNETTRKVISDRNSLSTVATIAIFFASGEATGTHEEFGLFGDGDTTATTGAANSGILYSHVVSQVTVGATQNLTCTFILTMST